MKKTILLITVVLSIFGLTQYGFTHGDEEHDSSKGSMMEQEEDSSSKAHIATEEELVNLPNIGNKICPASGEVIAEVGEGKGVQMAYQGSIYNFCCTMCAKDFRKDPEKFVKIVEEMMAKEEAEEHDHGDHEGNESEHHDHDEEATEEDEGDHHDDHGDHDH